MTDCTIDVWVIKGYDNKDELVLMMKIKADNRNLYQIMSDILNNYWVVSIDMDFKTEKD